VGSLAYRSRTGTTTFALVHRRVGNVGDAWDLALAHLRRRLAGGGSGTAPALPADALAAAVAEVDLPPAAAELLQEFAASAHQMGRRVAELHLVLAAETDRPEFAPEPFGPHYRRSLQQSMRNSVRGGMRALRRRAGALPAELRPLAQAVAGLEGHALEVGQAAFAGSLSAQRLRTHGWPHLKRFLNTGRDFALYGFEGDAERPLAERRIKRSALRDLAVTVYAFHEAAQTALLRARHDDELSLREAPAADRFAQRWSEWAAAAFVQGWLRGAAGASFVPGSAAERERLLRAYVLDQAVSTLARHLEAEDPAQIAVGLSTLLTLGSPPSP
jgi:maltose alpha-D-glucosyltransferase/alpha-amylase